MLGLTTRMWMVWLAPRLLQQQQKMTGSTVPPRLLLRPMQRQRWPQRNVAGRVNNMANHHPRSSPHQNEVVGSDAPSTMRNWTRAKNRTECYYYFVVELR